MKTFFEWMKLREDQQRTSARTGQYAVGYGSIGLYPPGDLVTHAADAISYLSKEQRKLKGIDGPPFDILRLKGDHGCKTHIMPKYKLPSDTSTQFKYNMPPDTSEPYKRDDLLWKLDKVPIKYTKFPKSLD